MVKRILVCLILIPLGGFCIPMAHHLFEKKGFVCYLLYFAVICAIWIGLVLGTNIVVH